MYARHRLNSDKSIIFAHSSIRRRARIRRHCSHEASAPASVYLQWPLGVDVAAQAAPRSVRASIGPTTETNPDMKHFRHERCALRAVAALALAAGLDDHAERPRRASRASSSTAITAVAGQAHRLRDACAAARSASSTRTTRRTRSSPTSSSAARRRRQGRATRPRFTITKPVDLAKASGFLWHDVPNRGGNIIINRDRTRPRRHRPGQRLAGRQRRRHRDPGQPRQRHQPLGAGADGARSNGQLVTGNVLARIVNRSGVDVAAAQRDGQPGALPAGDARHDASAVLTTHTKETVDGQVTVGSVIPSDRLGVRALQRGQPVRRPHADRQQRGQPARQPAGARLPEGRLRPEPALPGGLPGEGRLRARRRRRRVPRRRLVLQVRRRRTTSAPPTRSPDASPARRCAAARSRATSRASSSTWA